MTTSPCILCLGVDAIVLRDVRAALPDAVILTARDGDDVLQALAVGPQVVVQGGPDPLAALLPTGPDRIPMIAIVGPAATMNAAEADVVLRRPVDRRALRTSLLALARAEAGRRDAALSWLRHRIFDPTTSWEPIRVFSLLRLFTLTMVLLDVMASGDVGTVMVGVVAAVHVIARVRWAGLGLPLVAADAVIWLVLSIALGQFPSPFLLLLVLGAAQLGHLREARAAAVGVFVAGVLVVSTVADGSARDLAVLLPLLLLAGLLGEGIAVVVGGGGGPGRRVLEQVQASLQGLHEHARANPGRLEVGRVRRDMVLSTRDTLHAARVVLLDLGALEGPACVAVGQERDLVPDWGALRRDVAGLRTVSLVEGGELRAIVGGGRTVVAASLAIGHGSRGAVVAAWDTVLAPKARRDAMRALAGLGEEAALAIDNAELFEAINELSVSGERGRLAAEIHDGIVQSFVHIGFELERLARDLADVDVSSALRVIDLRHVVRDAVAETRAVVGSLQRESLDEGLEVALRCWLQRTPGHGGPPVTLAVDSDRDVPPEMVPELLRVVQEAVANARQHANATHILVRVVHDLEDDGQGLVFGPRVGGLGLASMEERLRRLGGDLRVERVRPAGTRVIARVPELLSIGSAR